jgi:hypothetical protein
MNPEVLWIAVIVVGLALLLGVALFGMTRRRRRAFPIQHVEPRLLEAYRERIPELEQMFVDQPREAVASAKLLVDDMLTRMGYPIRISNEERVRDLELHSRAHAGYYRGAAIFKGEPSTEQLRRALQAYIRVARETMDEAETHHAAGRGTDSSRREMA